MKRSHCDIPASLQSLQYDRATKTLAVLDQLRIPHASTYIDVPDSDAAWQVIKKMQVRGAPLIGIVAALGLAVEAHRAKNRFRTENRSSDAEAAASWLQDRMNYLK